MNFTEKQSMKKIWGLMLPMPLFILLIIYAWLSQESATEKQEAIQALVVVAGVSVVIAILFFSMSLHTTITEKGIYFQYKPFAKPKHFKWADIESVSVGRHKPQKGAFLAKSKQMSYTVWGNTNLLIKFKKGNSIIIGTQKATELALFLKRLKEKYAIKEIGEAQLNG